ncbi:MAG: hypothetical protein LBB94_11915 [Clostridiales bacterium]|jgi:hypothetical protein|nr:hypothetical protein [Clostridiales bacterium]
MAKNLRKTYGKADAPLTVALMRLIETQSKSTVANWTLDYAETKILPLFPSIIRMTSVPSTR